MPILSKFLILTNTKINFMNLKENFSNVDQYFSPKIIDVVNDQYVKVAKIKGQEIPWHNHENEDELFYIVDGELLMEIENTPSFTMKKGDLFVVKKGVNHRVSSVEECLIMLIESKTTEHTGKVKSNITKSIEEQTY
jgi:quercetin dioxygenase-like cupin family protein